MNSIRQWPDIVSPIIIVSVSIFVLNFNPGHCCSHTASNRFACGGQQLTSYECVDADAEGEFWAAIELEDPDSRKESIGRFLEEHLIGAVNDPLRRWTLESISDVNWFLDLTDFEGVFKSCEDPLGSLCMTVYVENKLVHGDRLWKTNLLRKALSTPYDELKGGAVKVKSGGIVTEIRPVDACKWVHDLGLLELRAMAQHTCPGFVNVGTDGSSGNAEVISEHEFDLVGTEDGNLHPATVLTERIAQIPPEEIIERIVNDDIGFRNTVGRYQRLLLTNAATYKDGSWAGTRTISDSDLLPALMEPLAKAYLWFLENPPVDSVNSMEEYHALHSKITYFLRGGCDGVALDSYAFDSPRDQVGAKMKAERKVFVHLGNDPDDFVGNAYLEHLEEQR